MTTLNNTAELAGRILLAAIFLLSGLTKITGYARTQAYMESAGVPGILLPGVILLEVGGALAVIVGFQTRLAALALAGFSLAAAVLFHANFGDQIQFIMFMKNLAIAGGFLIVFNHGAGAWSLDARRALS